MKFQTDGVHHVSVRVRELEKASQFYGGVLGFEVQDLGNLRYFAVGPTLVVLLPPLPGTPADDRVIDARLGFDHVAFHVSERGELEKLAGELAKVGVATAGVERDPVLDNDYVCFRDPDNTQWEFYCVPCDVARRSTTPTLPASAIRLRATFRPLRVIESDAAAISEPGDVRARLALTSVDSNSHASPGKLPAFEDRGWHSGRSLQKEV